MSTPFVVTVTGGRVDEKISLVRDVRAVTGFGLQDAVSLVEGRLSVVAGTEDDAYYFASVLSAAGARSSVVALAAAPNRPRLQASIRRTPPKDADRVGATRPLPSNRVSSNFATRARDIEVARARGIASKFQERVFGAYISPVTEVAAVLGLRNARLHRVQAGGDALRTVLSAKGIDPSSRHVDQRRIQRHTLEQWLLEVKRWMRLASGSLPLLKSTRLSRLKELSDGCLPLLAEEPLLKADIDVAASVKLEPALLDSFAALGGAVPDSWKGALADNPRVAGVDWWIPAWSGRRIVPGTPLHPTVSPAVARLVTMRAKVQLVAPRPSLKMFERVVDLASDACGDRNPAIPRFQIHIDLDQDGGFVTNDKRAIEVAAIDLLGQLPGGRVKVDVVDPLQLGDSARFLFDLSDAGDRILADAIWTTTDHVARLLVRIEEHITFVTQKYLKGRNSLTEYNIEAGEIAEPYRLLLLYDYPAGFTRDGKYFDEEHLTRLERIASVGRRAGVYIFAHVPSGKPAGRLSSLVQLDPTSLGLPSGLSLPNASRPPGGDWSERERLTVADIGFEWEVASSVPPNSEVRKELFAGLLRDLQSSDTAKVDPSIISRLDLQKGLAVESVVDVEDSQTWWRGVSNDRLELSFGRMGASDVARVQFNKELHSSALIGGRTGSGKSTLLHALIMDAITRYSPEELTLYLCDLKEGVEFQQYANARLPHARAIAVESNREFAVSLLEALELEIADRKSRFKSVEGGTAVDLTQFRELSGQKWPRVLTVIDEFHKLFEQDDRLARRAMQLLENVIKQGRSFGIHTILASQSLANVDASFKSLAGQISYRLVLASSDSDSRILLGEENGDAKLLTKVGEGILNANNGARESNQRFQTTFWSPELRQTVLDRVLELAHRSGFDRHPHVFEGNAEVRADDYEPSLYRGGGQGVTIPVGAPMSMEPPVSTQFERGPGSNLLVVDVEGLGNLAVLITSLLAQRVEVTAIDFAAIEQEWEPVFDTLVAEGLDKLNRRRIHEVVDLLAKEVAQRHANSDYRAAPKVLTLIGVHRARELDPDDYDDDSLLTKVRRLVKDGPEVGVHVIAWSDRKASLDRRFDSQTLREFGLRFLGRMSEDDSRSLADTEQAAAITPAQLVFDDFDKAVTIVARRLGFPGPEWIGDVIRGG